jgi:hypothetical protein
MSEHPNNRAQTKKIVRKQVQTVDNNFIYDPKRTINESGIFKGHMRQNKWQNDSLKSSTDKGYMRDTENQNIRRGRTKTHKVISFC